MFRGRMKQGSPLYEETKMLWEYAKEKQVGSNMELFMRAAFTKVNESMAAVMEKRAQVRAMASRPLTGTPPTHPLTGMVRR